jgi:hypothetical protein
MIYGRNYEKIWFKAVDDRVLFFPYGVMGRGYVVEPEAQRKIESFVRKWLSFSVAILAIVLLPGVMLTMDRIDPDPNRALALWLPGLAKLLAVIAPIYLVLFAIYAVGIGRMTSGLEPSTIRLTRSDIVGNRARLLSRGRVECIFWAGIVMALGTGSLLLKSLSNPGWGTLWWAGSLLFFLFCLRGAVRLRRAQSRGQSSGQDAGPPAR